MLYHCKLDSAAFTILPFLCGLLALTACNDSPVNVNCPAIVLPAVVVEVQNAATDAPEAKNAAGYLIDGRYNDSMRVASVNRKGVPTALEGGHGRAGTYAVLIEKQGFDSWSRSGIQVSEGPCGPDTERLTADLDSVGK